MRAPRRAAAVIALALVALACSAGDTDAPAKIAEALSPPESGCTSATLAGHTYYFCGALRSWSSARSKCEAVGLNLARIDSSAENDFIKSQVGFLNRWIGANDTATEGRWVWTFGGSQFWSGTFLGSAIPGMFSRWAALQPDNALNQDCGVFRPDGTWSDEGCSALAGYVCESGSDLCQQDPQKVEFGECGCGVTDVDTDGDGVLDCKEKCPNDPTKITPGHCGCSDAPRPAGTRCNDGLCSANTTCNGAGVCGDPAVCPPPDSSCRYGLSRNVYYWFCDNDRMFADARVRCQSVGADLPVVEDAAEDAFITANINEHSFMGGTDHAVEGDWVWLSTGAPFWSGGASGSAVAGAYTNWESGQPSDGLLGKDCFVKDPPIGNGRWETRACTDSDAFVCERKPVAVPRTLDLLENPFLERDAQSANQIGPDGIKDNPNADPGQEMCGPGLDLVTTDAGEMEFSPRLLYVSPPPNTDPTQPDCRVLYKECDPDTNAELQSPSEDLLNQAPDPALTCEAVPGTPITKCGIDPDTIDQSPEGLCTDDVQCAGRGFVCALVCADVGCTVQERRCAFPKPGCLGLPEQVNCATATECAEDDHTGVADADAKQNDMQAHPPGNIDSLPAPPDQLANLPKATLGDYPAPDACSVDAGPTITLPKQSEVREVNVGNEKWGLFVTPKVQWGATARPLALLGESSMSANGEVGFDVGAYVWKKEVHIINVSALAKLEDSCTLTIDRTVEVFGVAIDPGDEGLDIEDPGFKPVDCAKNYGDRAAKISALKQALVNAVAVKEYYEKFGATLTLCNALNRELTPLNSPLICGDCSTPTARQCAVDYWFDKYQTLHQELATAQGKIETSRQDVIGQLPGVRLPVFEDSRHFTAFDTKFTYPVGPATVTIEIEVGGSWGASGGLEMTWTPKPTGLSTAAEIHPTAEATAFAYAGVGFGPVSFGISGELLLIGAQAPLVAELALQQTTSADTRPHHYFNDLGLPPSTVFQPTKCEWTGTWTYGARPELFLLSGKINLEARVDLFFYTKRFKKKIADWKGKNKVFDFVGTSDGLALQGDPDFGIYGDDIPYLDPTRLRQLAKPSAQNLNEASEPAWTLVCQDPTR